MVVCNNSAQQINVALKDLQKQLDSIKLEFQKTTAKSEESSEETATGIEGKINSLQKQINELQAQLNTANGNISNLNSNVISISNNLSDVNENASSAKTTANEAKTTADNAKTTANEAKTTADKAMPKGGGTFTGPINLPAKQLPNYAMNLNNGDIIGLNVLKMADPAGSDGEGIVWIKSDGTTETLRALDGKLTLGGKEFAYKDDVPQQRVLYWYLNPKEISNIDTLTEKLAAVPDGTLVLFSVTWVDYTKYAFAGNSGYFVRAQGSTRCFGFMRNYSGIGYTMFIDWIDNVTSARCSGWKNLPTSSAAGDQPISSGPTADEPIPDGPGV